MTGRNHRRARAAASERRPALTRSDPGAAVSPNVAPGRQLTTTVTRLSHWHPGSGKMNSVKPCQPECHGPVTLSVAVFSGGSNAAVLVTPGRPGGPSPLPTGPGPVSSCRGAVWWVL